MVRSWSAGRAHRNPPIGHRYAADGGAALCSLAAAGDSVAAGAQGALFFWDRRTGEQLARFEDTHPEAVTQAGRAAAKPKPYKTQNPKP